MKRILYLFAILCLSFVAGVMGVSALDKSGGLKLYAVSSGSMAPAISAGSLVVSVPSAKYEVGDVITFKSEKERNAIVPKFTTTHRIKEILSTAGNTYFTTQGDANRSADLEKVDNSLVLGKTVFSIPFLGYPISFARTEAGFLLLIIIPAVLIVYTELLNIKKEIIKLWGRRFGHSPNWQKINLGAYLLPLLLLAGIVSLPVGSTNGVYSDNSSFSANSFKMKETFASSSLKLSDDKKTVTMKVEQITGYVTIAYELTYDTDSTTQGVAGSTSVSGQSQFSRDISLSTCTSGGTCVYHEGVHNFKLKVDLTDGEGHTAHLETTL